jgi:hypothetical protein
MWSVSSLALAAMVTFTSTAAPRSVQNSLEQWSSCLPFQASCTEVVNSVRKVALAASVQSQGAIAAARSARGSLLIALAASSAGTLSGCVATT